MSELNVVRLTSVWKVFCYLGDPHMLFAAPPPLGTSKLEGTDLIGFEPPVGTQYLTVGEVTQLTFALVNEPIGEQKEYFREIYPPINLSPTHAVGWLVTRGWIRDGTVTGQQQFSAQAPYSELRWVRPLDVFQYFTSSTTDEVTRFLSALQAQ